MTSVAKVISHAISLFERSNLLRSVTALSRKPHGCWQHYRDVFASLRAHNLEPLVTVNHFTLPTWVHDPITARPLVQLGLPAPAAGWLSPTTPVEFEKYAAYVAWKYGDQVDNWATLNEPFPPVLTEFLAIPSLLPNWPPGVIRPAHRPWRFPRGP